MGKETPVSGDGPDISSDPPLHGPPHCNMDKSIVFNVLLSTPSS